MRRKDESQATRNGLFDRAQALLGQAPSGLKSWLQTGAALGVARTGVRVAGRVIRRNPGLAIAAAVVGTGVVAYTAYRKRAQAVPAPGEPIDSTATVVETRSKPKRVRRTSREDAPSEVPPSQARKPRPRQSKASRP